MDLELTHYNRDGIEVVVVMTELDVYNTPKMRKLLIDLIKQQHYEPVFDLENVEFLDSLADEQWPHCEGPHKWDEVNPARSPRTSGSCGGSGRQRQADLLQVLWCPFDHGLEPYPKPALYWRTADTIADILTDPPEPPAVQFDGYLPEPCLLGPEQVTDYPNFMELSQDLQELVEQWSRRQTEGTGPGSAYTIDPKMFYWDELSVAPGWKVGGWPSWGLTDPIPQYCPDCGTSMDPLPTIASTEWDRNTRGWIPYEDQAYADTPRYVGVPHPAHPTMVQIADDNRLQLYVCPALPDTWTRGRGVGPGHRPQTSPRS